MISTAAHLQRRTRHLRRGLIRSQQVPSRLKRRPPVVYFPIVDTKPAGADEAKLPS